MAVGRWWRRYRGWVAVAALAAIGLTAYLVLRGGEPETAATTYTTTTAERGTISVTVAGSGNLDVRDLVSVTPKVSGTIASLAVEKGDKVEAGDVLFVLDDEDADKATAQALASQRQAQQSVHQAEVSVLQAQDSLDGLEERSSDVTNAPTDDELTIARKQVTIAKEGLTSAKAALKRAKTDYANAKADESDLTVTAPCDGVVWTLDVDKGDSVSAGGGASTTQASTGSGGTSAPLTIARDGELAVLLAVNEVDVPSLKVGQSVDLAFDALPDLTVTGKVDEIATEGTVEQGVVSYEVWVSLDVTDKRLRTGMSGSATIVTAVARDVLLVPNSAVKTATDGSKYVQVLDSGAAEPRDVSVTTGLEGSSQTVITGGLKGGEAVVTKTSNGSASGSSGTQSSPGAGGMMFLGGGPR